MEEKEKTNAEETPEETAPQPDEVSEEEQSRDTAGDISELGRALARELREVIGEEVSRHLAREREEAETPELSELLCDPSFLSLLAGKLAEGRPSAPPLRRRGSTLLPAGARREPKTLDDAREAARKYFKVN